MGFGSLMSMTYIACKALPTSYAVVLVVASTFFYQDHAPLRDSLFYTLPETWQKACYRHPEDVSKHVPGTGNLGTSHFSDSLLFSSSWSTGSRAFGP